KEFGMRPLIGFCVLALLVPGLAFAQQGSVASSSADTAALEQKIRDLEDRLIALEGQMRTMKAQASPAPTAAPAPATSAEAERPEPSLSASALRGQSDGLRG